MRPLTSKQISGASLLIALLGFPAIVGQTNRHKQDPFRKFVTRLPDIGRLEIVEVRPVLTDDLTHVQCNQAGLICAPDNFPYRPEARKILAGAEASKFTRFWRSLRRDRMAPRDQCLTPDHILRFFKGNSLILQTQICAFCNQISLPTIGAVAVESHSYPYYDLREVLVSDAQLQRPWQSFKQKMMPQVGKRITLIGLIGLGKGFDLKYDDWYIGLDEVDVALTNKLLNMGCHTAVRVTGILQYYHSENVSGPVSEQRLPDHFYFKQPQIEVVRVEKVNQDRRSRARN